MNWINVTSSNLDSVLYDETSNSLFIKFHHGGVYEYFDVPQYIYENLLNAPSHGKYHAQFIKRKFRYIQM